MIGYDQKLFENSARGRQANFWLYVILLIFFLIIFGISVASAVYFNKIRNKADELVDVGVSSREAFTAMGANAAAAVFAFLGAMYCGFRVVLGFTKGGQGNNDVMRIRALRNPEIAQRLAAQQQIAAPVAPSAPFGQMQQTVAPPAPFGQMQQTVAPSAPLGQVQQLVRQMQQSVGQMQQTVAQMKPSSPLAGGAVGGRERQQSMSAGGDQLLSQMTPETLKNMESLCQKLADLKAGIQSL